MVGKKVSFTQKPVSADTEKFIDKWISNGSTRSTMKKDEPVLKRTTIYLPEDIRHKLKIKALKEDTTMTEIIVEAIKSYML